MKNTFYSIAIVSFFIGGCSLLSPRHFAQKSLKKATAQKWNGGAPGSGRGVIFQLKFVSPNEEINGDTLWVNEVAMRAEFTHVGDTTFVTSYYNTTQEFQPLLVNDQSYSGHLKIIKSEKRFLLAIKTFDILALNSFI